MRLVICDVVHDQRYRLPFGVFVPDRAKDLADRSSVYPLAASRNDVEVLYGAVDVQMVARAVVREDLEVLPLFDPSVTNDGVVLGMSRVSEVDLTLLLEAIIFEDKELLLFFFCLARDGLCFFVAKAKFMEEVVTPLRVYSTPNLFEISDFGGVEAEVA